MTATVPGLQRASSSMPETGVSGGGHLKSKNEGRSAAAHVVQPGVRFLRDPDSRTTRCASKSRLRADNHGVLGDGNARIQ
ncbi:hypothetical protein HPB50_021374 [Hyalomma asiaticum]|uniref:Uncharacterized protein n=1 Tax=Hyalomma asiaticum TaxID=266040 RepID=A0ACB7SYJ2_HYAAI|nr:hypothetical protein HPB50_021374 [Hyalomma asiaticum]